MDQKKYPESYRNAVVPHIIVDGAEEALMFYAEAFGAQELFRAEESDGSIIYAELSIEGSVVMVGETGGFFTDPFSLQTTSVGLHVYVEDIHKSFSKALNAGAIPLKPVQDMFSGGGVGMLKDPFGHIWVLLESHKNITAGQIKMKK
jgi:PhnB protein